MTTVQERVRTRILRRMQGKVFTPKDFLDIAGRDATDQTLSRLVRAGDLERLGRGLYHSPQFNVRLGIRLAPDPDEIAEALGRQTGSRVAPSGAVAANRLGLSTQVPAKPVYLTDGRTRRVKVGNFVVEIRHVAPKELPSGSRTSALVFQALRHLGPKAVDDRIVAKIRKVLTAKQRRELLRDARYATDWIAEAARAVADDDGENANHG